MTLYEHISLAIAKQKTISVSQDLWEDKGWRANIQIWEERKGFIMNRT